MTEEQRQFSTPATQCEHLVSQPRFGFRILLICMILLLLVPSYFDKPLTGGLVLSILLSTLLLSALYLVAYRMQELLIGIAIAIPILFTLWWDAVLPAPWNVYAVNSLYLIFICYIGLLIGRFLFETDRISLDMIIASVCLYLLIGLLWAFIYQMIEVGHPGSFKFAGVEVSQLEHVRYMRSQFAYYSYVTLSTLGYGDIVPVTRLARSWAALETLTGQFYLAVVIARLVGLYATRDSNDTTS